MKFLNGILLKSSTDKSPYILTPSPVITLFNIVISISSLTTLKLAIRSKPQYIQDARDQGVYLVLLTPQHFFRPCVLVKDTCCANYSPRPAKRHIFSPSVRSHWHKHLQTKEETGQPQLAFSLRRPERDLY